MKTKTHSPARSFPLLRALVVPVMLGLAGAAGAQVSPWYITQGTAGNGNTYVMQGGALVNQYQWSGPGQIPIYVDNLVHQAEYTGTGAPGETYSLTGLPMSSPNFFNNGGQGAYDAGFDGKDVYIVDWPTGNVSTYAPNYAGAPVYQFTAFQNDLGITVHGGNVWTSNWGSGMISQWVGGQLVNQFPGYGSHLSALAYDCADNTLWVADAHNNIGRQFDLAGNLLQQTQLPDYVLGGEIGCIPGPGPAALAGLAALTAVRRRTRAETRA